jgi:hypothetical protein
MPLVSVICWDMEAQFSFTDLKCKINPDQRGQWAYFKATITRAQHGKGYIKMTDFWDVTPCTLVEVHRRFKGAYSLHHQGDLWNACLLPRDYTALQPRKLSSSHSPPWEPEISHDYIRSITQEGEQTYTYNTVARSSAVITGYSLRPGRDVKFLYLTSLGTSHTHLIFVWHDPRDVRVSAMFRPAAIRHSAGALGPQRPLPSLNSTRLVTRGAFIQVSVLATLAGWLTALQTNKV